MVDIAPVAPVAVIGVRNWLVRCARNANRDWAKISTEWDPGLRDRLQVVVIRTGGARADLVTDRPQITIQVYGPSQSETEDAAQDVEAWVVALPSAKLANFNVRRVEWLSGPVVFPDMQKRPRVQMTFWLRLRVG